MKVAALAIFLLLLLTAIPTRAQERTLRVIADPNNLPFSNERLEGFENKIATLLAKDFNATPTYIWWGQRRGFIRNTMNATLKEGRCDIVIGVPSTYDLVRTTKPYYRSTYVFVQQKTRKPIESLDDPVLKKLTIGVHLLGDDYSIADIAIWPWVNNLLARYGAGELVGIQDFAEVQRVLATFLARPAVQRGMKVPARPAG